jgi:hypothetical protein
MKPKLRDLRKIPFFPFVPLVPLAVIGGMLALELFVLKRLRSIGSAVDGLLEQQAMAAS